MTSAMVGPTRDNIHATVGSTTWNPHRRSNTHAGSIFFQQQVESAIAEQCAFRKISRGHPTPPFSLRLPLPPLFRTKASQNLLSLKLEIMYGYEGCTCPLKETPFKRPSSKVFFVSFRQLCFNVSVAFFSDKTLNRFQPYRFLFLDASQNRMQLGQKQQRAPLVDLELTGPRGEHL